MQAPAQNNWKAPALTTGVVIAALSAGIYFTDLTPAPTPRTITLQWDLNNSPVGLTTEVWSSTNLTTWTLKTNVVGTNRVTLPATNRAEFFKIRTRRGFEVSDWARRP